MLPSPRPRNVARSVAPASPTAPTHTLSSSVVAQQQKFGILVRGCRVLTNIIDHRKRPYRWATISAIVEATLHDNSVADADHAPPSEVDGLYAEMDAGSLADAVAWANTFPGPTTLYLYDAGEGIALRPPTP